MKLADDALASKNSAFAEMTKSVRGLRRSAKRRRAVRSRSLGTARTRASGIYGSKDKIVTLTDGRVTVKLTNDETAGESRLKARRSSTVRLLDLAELPAAIGGLGALNVLTWLAARASSSCRTR